MRAAPPRGTAIKTDGTSAAQPGQSGRPTLTIDLDAIAENWRALDRLGRAETGAAVKADGYGLGAAQVGPALAAAGCRTFFTASAGEAGSLRAALGPEPVIYVLNGAIEGLSEIEDAEARPVLNTAEELREADAFGRARGRPLAAAVQVETGMNRLGASAEALARVAETGLEGVRTELVLSHLASSDTPRRPQNRAQRTRFAEAMVALQPFFPEARASLAATGGTLAGRDFAYDLVRPGIGLYGGLPFAKALPVVTLTAPIMRVFEVEAGETSGYGASWTATRRSRLATIPVGYADGLPRLLSNRGVAKVGGVEVPYAGRVSMDLIVLDVTAVDRPPEVGDAAVLLDADITVDRIATTVETIGYEILTRLGPRFRRVYRTERNNG